MVINRIMGISMTLADLSLTKQRIKAKKTFEKGGYCVLVVKMC